MQLERHDEVERGNVPLTAGEVRSLVDELVTMKASATLTGWGRVGDDVCIFQKPILGCIETEFCTYSVLCNIFHFAAYSEFYKFYTF